MPEPAAIASIEEHLDRILDRIDPLPSRSYPLLDAIGRPVAADVAARWVPPAAGGAATQTVRPGDVVLRAGSVLGPRQVGMLAGLGVDRVKVAPRPRVVVISTGPGLVEPGRPLPAGAIPDASSHLLAAAVRATGAIAYRATVSDGDPVRFLSALEDQLARADLVVTTGSAGQGDHDVVRAALGSADDMWFGEVAMRPGGCQGFGFVGRDRVPLFALPGSAAAAYVCFEVLVAPALRRLVGRTPLRRPLFRAELATGLSSVIGTRQFVYGDVTVGPGGARVVPVIGPGSRLLDGLGAANALIVLDESVGAADASASVPVMLLDREY